MEQSVNVNFCVKQHKSPSEMLEILETIYDESLGQEATDVKVQIKTMLICFFDIRGIIHFEFVPEETTVNQTFYLEMLKRLIDAVRHKGAEFWRDRSLILDHDNAPAHSSLRVSQFLTEKGISAMDHPPYSPDLVPAEF
jgi:hypothetical protein